MKTAAEKTISIFFYNFNLWQNLKLWSPTDLAPTIIRDDLEKPYPDTLNSGVDVIPKIY